MRNRRICRMGQTLVEHHRHVGAELRLDIGRSLRRQQMGRTVEMRLKVRALLVDLPPGRQAEYLVAAAVGENWLRPADKPMQAATPRNEIVAGPEVKMIGVAEEHGRAHRVEIPMSNALH